MELVEMTKDELLNRLVEVEQIIAKDELPNQLVEVEQIVGRPLEGPDMIFAAFLLLCGATPGAVARILIDDYEKELRKQEVADLENEYSWRVTGLLKAEDNGKYNELLRSLQELVRDLSDMDLEKPAGGGTSGPGPS